MNSLSQRERFDGSAGFALRICRGWMRDIGQGVCLEREDYEQAALLGLWAAVRAFDAGKAARAGARFETYARHRILGALRDEHRRQASRSGRMATLGDAAEAVADSGGGAGRWSRAEEDEAFTRLGVPAEDRELVRLVVLRKVRPRVAARSLGIGHSALLKRLEAVRRAVGATAKGAAWQGEVS